MMPIIYLSPILFLKKTQRQAIIYRSDLPILLSLFISFCLLFKSEKKTQLIPKAEIFLKRTRDAYIRILVN